MATFPYSEVIDVLMQKDHPDLLKILGRIGVRTNVKLQSKNPTDRVRMTTATLNNALMFDASTTEVVDAMRKIGPEGFKTIFRTEDWNVLIGVIESSRKSRKPNPKAERANRKAVRDDNKSKRSLLSMRK